MIENCAKCTPASRDLKMVGQQSEKLYDNKIKLTVILKYFETPIYIYENPKHSLRPFIKLKLCLSVCLFVKISAYFIWLSTFDV